MSHWQKVELKGEPIDMLPEDLWRMAQSYFKWCDDNPILTKRVISTGKDAGTRVDEERVRPYTIKGLCLHCDIFESYLKSMMEIKETGSEYSKVVEKIYYVIHIQIMEYAITGIFSPILCAKLLNLDNGIEENNKPIIVNITAGTPELSTSESEIIKKLELENQYIQIEEDEKS